jgi:predicted GNAT family acetyltransferase
VPSQELTVKDDPTELRYEALREGELVAEIRYLTEPGVVVLVHTEVNPSEEGSGLGSLLVRAALDDIRERGLHVVPVCPFVAAYIRRHPEYADLVIRNPVTRG